MPTHVLSDAEHFIVREGLAAADLLASEALRSVSHTIMVDAFTAFTESKPDCLAERENHYNIVRGLKAIEAELNARVQRKDEIERRLDEEAGDDAEALIDDAALGDRD
jgi:hypothetical protein